LTGWHHRLVWQQLGIQKHGATEGSAYICIDPFCTNFYIRPKKSTCT
jgi:hypothetical protein